MTRTASGRLSELALVRMHGRALAYLDASDEERAEIVVACRRESSVPDLAERILSRTIYAQASCRVGPLRELLQNAIDASPRGARIDVRSAAPWGTANARRDLEITVADRGQGMHRDEILSDLLVPFRSGKEGDPEAIGEHGVGFLSALEIAPRIEITTATEREAHRLKLQPASASAPYSDFTWTLTPIDPRELRGTGTAVRLELEQPIDRVVLAAEIAAAAGLVDPDRARIFVNDVFINGARDRLHKVARAPIGQGAAFGELELFLGHGAGIPPRLLVTQRGLLVAAPEDTRHGRRGAPRSLHGDIVEAITAAGYGLVADLPRAVPLNQGRSAVAAIAARAVEDALTEAFERFVLEDALYNRELLRSVDHRLSSVLDRLVVTALAGECAREAKAPLPEAERAGAPHQSALGSAASCPGAPASAAPAAVEPKPVPTVAAPEEVVRFASALLDAPMFLTSTFERIAPHGPASAPPHEVRARRTLRAVLQAHREGRLRPLGESRTPGVVYISLADPLSQALFRRLSMPEPVAPEVERAHTRGALMLPCVSRRALLRSAAQIPGVRALVAAITVIERIDAAISAAAGLDASAISVHQDLYGPDEMAHTDGVGISLNLAAPRIRALLTAILGDDDPIAFGALVDLVLHEKSHVSLASYVPRSTAEHGSSFYRRKDWLRCRLLSAIATGEIPDPVEALAAARATLTAIAMPCPEALAFAFHHPESMAA